MINLQLNDLLLMQYLQSLFSCYYQSKLALSCYLQWISIFSLYSLSLSTDITLPQVPCVAGAPSKIDIIQVYLDTALAGTLYLDGPFPLAIKWQGTTAKLAQLPLETDINAVSDTPRRRAPSGQRAALYTMRNWIAIEMMHFVTLCIQLRTPSYAVKLICAADSCFLFYISLVYLSSINRERQYFREGYISNFLT